MRQNKKSSHSGKIESQQHQYIYEFGSIKDIKDSFQNDYVNIYLFR
jgi:hypothetical protein